MTERFVCGTSEVGGKLQSVYQDTRQRSGLLHFFLWQGVCSWLVLALMASFEFGTSTQDGRLADHCPSPLRFVTMACCVAH